MEHFENPEFAGELENADGAGTVGNPVCGDLMTVYIKVEGGRISDLRFKTFGCASAIATTDMICGLAKGMTLEEAKNITKEQIAEALDGLPKIKMHCSNLADRALIAAINDYESKNRSPRAERRSPKKLSGSGACECCERNRGPSKPAGKETARSPKK